MTASGTGTGTMPPIAIVGMGCIYPKAEDLAAYWALIRSRGDAIGEVPASHWRPEEYFDADPSRPDRTYGRRGGFISPVDFHPIEHGVTPNTLEATDVTQLLGLVTAQRALEDAGYGACPGRGNPSPTPPAEGSSRKFDRERVSVVLGVTGTLPLVIPLGARLGHPLWRRALREAGVADAVADDVVERIAAGYVPWQEASFPGLLGNVVAGRIANRLDLHGTNCVVDAACASSLSAAHLASLELAAGRADMVVTGGMDAFNDIFMFMCFSKTPALSPTGNSKPFDRSGDGTILGEGFGVLVLKRLADAERDGDRIHAVIRGIGTASDGKGNAIYAPSAEGQRRCLEDAYARAGISPATVELVEAHGTGTRVGDGVEVKALTEVYRRARPEGTWCALGSVKSQIGHTKAAAGAAGLIKAALALGKRVLPPTIKVERPLEALAPGATPFYVNATERPWLPPEGHPRRAAVSSFGFGGSNFHCVLEEHAGTRAAIDWDPDVQVVALSAASREALAADLAALVEALPRTAPWREVRARAAASRAAFRVADGFRLAAVVERSGASSVEKVLGGALEMLRKDARGSFSTPQGAHFASGPLEGGVALLFPGQGSQYAGMLRDLACRFPAFQDTLAAADRVYAKDASGERISDAIYPHHAFDAETAKAQEAALRATERAQPAIGAVSLGALRVLEHLGLPAPVALAGHSYGELTALCAAGRLSEDELFALSRLRGRLMAEGSGDRGSMLAVSASATALEAIVAEERLALVLANRNAPDQVVLSGATAEIERAASLLEAKGLRATRLPVAAAFHSPLVAGAEAPFAAALGVVLLPSRGPAVFANTTAAAYPADAGEARQLLAGQLARPVEWTRLVEAMHAHGARTFVEVGPGARLSGLVARTLGERPHACIAVDASGGKAAGIADLGRALARLAAIGHPVRLERWDEGAPLAKAGARKPGAVALSGANFVQPRPAKPPAARATPPADVTRGGRASMQTIEITKAARSEGVSGSEATAGQGKAYGGAAHGANGGGNGNGNGGNGNGHGAHEAHATADLTPLVAPAAAHAAPPGAHAQASLAEALRATQESLALLARMQEQAADLHRRFLEGQEQGQRAIQDLLARQQRMFEAGLGLAPAPTAYVTAPQMFAPPALPAPAPATPTLPPLPAVGVGLRSTPTSSAGSAEQRPSEQRGGPEAHRHWRQEPTSPAPKAPAPSIGAPIADTLVAVVAEKTGYPRDVIELRMDLDADLGIDSIKRVEILSALQERIPGLPSVKPEQMGTLRTLEAIVGFLSKGAVARAAPAPAPAAAAPAKAAPAIAETLVAVVAEKTGYPRDVIELRMDLDADLGIDSIKRVEILSALQERVPGLPAVKPEHMGALRTLEAIVAFLEKGAAKPLAGAAAGGSPDPKSPAAGDAQRAGGVSSEGAAALDRPVAALIRRVPRAVPLAQEREAWAPPAGAPFLVLDDGGSLAADVARALEARGAAARVLPLEEAASLDAPGSLGGLVLLAPEAGSSAESMRIALGLARRCARSLRAARGALVTVSRLDGRFALGGGAPRDPHSGALAGLAKTAAIEWPEVRARALDLSPALGASEAAAAVADEALRAGPLEVGLAPEGRFAIDLVDEAAPPAAPLPFRAGEAVLVTGGARGVTAEAAVALARPGGAALVLLGRSAAPSEEPAWLAPLASAGEIKAALFQREGRGAAPAAIESRFREIAANREALATLRRIEARGARARYRSLDVRDAEAVRAAVAAIRAEVGPITGLVHGAGVLADRLIEDKTDADLDRVYGTKVGGLEALLAALEGEPLRGVALFSSSTARFGRRGQSDYAMANEALNKLAAREAARRKDARVVAIGWGPWDGGMVTPGLRALFTAEGVGIIPLDAGAELAARELAAPPGGAAEVVVLGAPPSEAPSSPHLEPFDSASSAARSSAQDELRAAEGRAESKGPILESVLVREVDVASHPVLESHVIRGRAVLPLALTAELLAHGALLENPGLRLHGFDDLRVLKGVTLEGERPAAVEVLAGVARREEGGAFRAAVEMRLAASAVRHARAEVVLAARLPEAPAPRPAPSLGSYPLSVERLYDEVLFHGPALRAIEAVLGISSEAIRARVRTAPAPAAWLRSPLRGRWLADPLALDAAFQLMIAWTTAERGAASLPVHVRSYRQFADAFPPEGVEVTARIVRVHPGSVEADIDIASFDGRVVARLEGYECVLDASLADAFRRNRVAPLGAR